DHREGAEVVGSRDRDQDALAGGMVGGAALDGGAEPMAWYPPSTWTISPVIPRERSESRNTIVSATGVASVGFHPSGARSPQPSASVWNPGIPLPAIVRRGPADRVLTRIP